jgi:hypothetical protein
VVAAVVTLRSHQIKELGVPGVPGEEEALKQVGVLEDRVLLVRETMVELVVLAVTEMAAEAAVQIQIQLPEPGGMQIPQPEETVEPEQQVLLQVLR